jgi:rare lipoprotein A
MRRRARSALPALVVVAATLAGCASGPGSRPGRDGPEARPPAGLDQVPDAVPRVEPLRVGGPNKPYRVLGRSYTPMTEDLPLQEEGLASWYGRKFHGQPTSNGEVYDMYAMTAAHKTMPLPSYARVRNPANGREIIVRVNDRGPFADGRVIDLSYTAALKLGVLGGVAPVQVQRLTFDDIRNGRWREAGRGSEAVPAPRAEDGLPGDGPPVASAGFWLQLGAFRQRDGALLLQQQVLGHAEAGVDAVAVFEEDGLFRVQAGPYATRGQAQKAAERLRRQTGRSALVLERGAP